MNRWSIFLRNNSKKALFYIKTVFSNRKSLVRWTLGINVAALLVGLAYRQDDIKPMLTKQAYLFSQYELPVFMRRHIYGAYSRYYGVNLDEVELPLNDYPTFGDFFTRRIRRQLPTATPNTLVSPCDAKILNCQEVTEDRCQIIKGATYSLSELILNRSHAEGEKPIHERIKKDSNHKLYQIILYLSPGDYHRFHSPADLTVLKQINIPGGLDSVNEETLVKGKPIYEKNSRVTLITQWLQGSLAMVMVGALNVSRIYITDKKQLKVGSQVGYFNLGSTIVLLVEAKGIKEWKIKAGEKVKYGQPLFEYVE